ncbi:hypothetical protein QE197_22760 (plasmid) [Arsenophonus nasoniae]|uniref:Uncharacterized protein n=1 Tax=Arsenophonus nasoniae TaxID=638 RepID=A0ABY8NW99_9GAMM|nr:hypothetical protein [Arsenophonus nasoniae]WGM08577.1 hypothetical protein QE258_25000 [Arsenophonus nasoniae]WGM13379.1 hypothetical protein QE197_22760 [Arsenophonus nasoniae]WGM17952.1 hypothetical protein QE193_22645 [Arsenophonus nasoniae]
MTPCHRSLTAGCHAAIDHLGSSGTWNTGAMYGEDMPRKPLEGLPSPKNGRMASWHRAVRESFKVEINSIDKFDFCAGIQSI